MFEFVGDSLVAAIHAFFTLLIDKIPTLEPILQIIGFIYIRCFFHGIHVLYALENVTVN